MPTDRRAVASLSSVNKSVETLRSAALTRSFTSAFCEATGLPLALEAPGEFVLPRDHVPEFCRGMAAVSRGCQDCRGTHLALQDERTTRSARCFAGLTSSAVPVLAGGRAVCYLHTGHVVVDDGAAGRKAGRRVPAVTRANYRGALRLLEIFAQQVGSGHLPEVQGVPQVAVDAAARRIREAPEKPWKLRDLAAQARLHPAYFSELFHDRTGLTLTDFVATARAVLAKDLLLCGHRQVIEVAFAAGFGSVSQFNRVFRRVHGKTPLQLRRQVSAKVVASGCR